MTTETIDYACLSRLVFEVTGLRVVTIDQTTRVTERRNFAIALENRHILLCSVLPKHMPSYIITSEVATMHYVRDYTSIPVPRVLAYGTDTSHPLGPYLIMDKPKGISLDHMFDRLSIDDLEAIITQIAKWAVNLFRLRFDAIGSLYPDSENGYKVGPIVRSSFILDGLARLHLNRGPFFTAKEYMLACVQREIDRQKELVAENASSEYQKALDNMSHDIDQYAELFKSIVDKCGDLDDGDPIMSPFTLDFHVLGMRNFILSEEDPKRIVAVTGWDHIATMPLWQCGRLPKWIRPSLSDSGDTFKAKLAEVFRHVVITESGKDSPFSSALDEEGSARSSLHDFCDYNAFTDLYIILPALQNIAATLPGHLDIAGLSDILDPTRVTGRVARILTTTNGSAVDAISLALSGLGIDESSSRPRRGSLRDAKHSEVTSTSR